MSKYSAKDKISKKLEDSIAQTNAPLTEKDDLTPDEIAKLTPEEFDFAEYDETAAERAGYSNYSYWRSTIRVFFKNKVAVTNLVIMLVLVLFMLLPTFLAGLFHATSPAIHNLIEGVVKILVLLAYMILCSRQKDVYRVFCYHGAEHKTIFCYEAGLPLTVENVRIQPRHHPRCGTSFLFVVIIVSIIVSSLVFPYINWQSVWVRVGVKLLLLVPVVGITYEFNRLVGAHDNALTRVLSAPGMWLQNFTTNEPDDSMLEVAIEALKLVIPEEKGTDTW